VVDPMVSNAKEPLTTALWPLTTAPAH